MTENLPQPIAYLYHDADSVENAHPYLHSTLLLMAAERRPELNNETALYTRAAIKVLAAASCDKEHTLRAPVEPTIKPQPTNAQDAAVGNENAIRHIAYADGYADGKAATFERCAAYCEQAGFKDLATDLRMLGFTWA